MTLFLRSVATAAVYAFEMLACLLGMCLLIGLAAAPLYADRLPFEPRAWQWALAFAVAIAIAISASWVKAVFERRLPGRLGGEPRYNHISGWSAVWMAAATAVIVALASWAATSDEHKQTINADWGVFILYGLTIAFVAAAFAPTLNLGDRIAGVASIFNWLIRPLGRVLSVIDSVLVFAIAGAAGATQSSALLRHVILAGVMISCGFLGYWLAAPWGLVPILWAFIATIAISRRWSWVEDDRELAMLNRRFTGEHLRIGFTQDLRGEALLAFMAMFFLVPLGLRQAQMAAEGMHFELFSIDPNAAQSLQTWMAFFGAELAKALPFVDWAEVYGVGSSDAGMVHGEMSQHMVFAIRILVDLVLVAALMQAIAISARNAKQRDLFYSRQLDRLDPFLEPREFRRLLRKPQGGALEPDAELVRGFPVYDPIRLSEFAGAQRNALLRRIANAVRIEQGGSNVAEFHLELVRRAGAPQRDKAALLEVLNAIRAAGPERMIDALEEARRTMNNGFSLVEPRVRLMELIAEAPDSPAKIQALFAAIASARDSLSKVRIAALSALADAAARGDQGAVAALEEAAQSDAVSKIEKRAIGAIQKRLNQTPAAPRPASAIAAAAAPMPIAPAPIEEPQPVPAAEAPSEAPPAAAPEADQPGEVQAEQAPAAEETAPMSAPSVQDAVAASQDKRRRPPYLLLAGLLVVALAVAGFLYWRYAQEQEAVAPPPQAPAPEVSAALPAEPTPPPTFRDCEECPEMMGLAGGSFQMGAPEGEIGRRSWEAPQHEVQVPAFAMGVREVSFAEWDACVAAGGCNNYAPPDRDWGRGARPVIFVSWRDAQAYVQWLSQRTGRAYRLPSEAEWEFAARGGSTGAYWWGDDYQLDRLAHGRQGTGETGEFAANGFGLFDVTGNVSEWVEDCYVNHYVGAPTDGTPVLAGDCERRVVRGGAWNDSAGGLRIASRSRVTRNVRDAAIGFRVASTP